MQPSANTLATPSIANTQVIGHAPINGAIKVGVTAEASMAGIANRPTRAA
jgi:hypothetical protein